MEGNPRMPRGKAGGGGQELRRGSWERKDRSHGEDKPLAHLPTAIRAAFPPCELETAQTVTVRLS